MKKCNDCGRRMSATVAGYICTRCRDQIVRGLPRTNPKIKKALESLERGVQAIQEFLRKQKNS